MIDQCYAQNMVIDCDDHRWISYDARGIPLAKVCHKCETKKLSVFRSDVLTDPNYETTEDIEAEPEVGGPYN